MPASGAGRGKTETVSANNSTTVNSGSTADGDIVIDRNIGRDETALTEMAASAQVAAWPKGTVISYHCISFHYYIGPNGDISSNASTAVDNCRVMNTGSRQRAFSNQLDIRA